MQERLLIPSPVELELKLDDHNFLFTDINALVKRIKTSTERIENDQILDSLTRNTDARRMIVKLNKYLKSQTSRPSLSKIFWHMQGRSFTVIMLLTFLLQAQDVILLQLLNQVTSMLQVYDTKDNLRMGLYMGAMIIVFQLKIYLQVKNEWTMSIWRCQTKCTIQYCIFMKALRTKCFNSQSVKAEENSEKKEEEENEKEKEKNKENKQKNREEGQKDANINNLMTVDVDQSLQLAWGISSGLLALLMLVILFYMLYQQIGSAIYEGLWVILGCLVFNFVFAIGVQVAYTKYMVHKDRRISLSTDLIESIKSIKSFSWEGIFQKKVDTIRSKEFGKLNILRGSDGFLAVFWQSLSYVLLFTFLTTYINKGHNLQDSNVFVIIAIFQLITFPLGILPWSVSSVLNARVSFMRISKFYNEEEIISDEVNVLDKLLVVDDESNDAIEIKQCQFKWPQRKLKRSKKEKKNIAECEQNKDVFSLEIEELKIQESKLTFLIGKIGSGKTALLNAIQNEMKNVFKSNKNNNYCELDSMIDSTTIKLEQKDINMKHITVRGSIGVVTQNHWLQNQTLRENILFGKPYNKDFYDTVINLCQLKQDLDQFKNKDLKLVLQNGSNLSGGQKQRVCLARSIYQDNDIYLFDDIFSSLDVNVAASIFQKLVKEYLVFQKKKTVLMVTSQYKYLEAGLDYSLVYLEKGKVIDDQSKVDEYLKDSNVTAEESLTLQKKKRSMKEEDKNHEKKCHQEEEGEEGDQEQETNEEYRIRGQISFQTYMSYFRDYGLVTVFLLLFFSLLMSASQTLIDYWLKDQVSTNHLSFFHPLNSYFNYSFTQVFTFLVLLNLVITIIRNIFYVLGSQFAAYRVFNRLFSALIFSNQEFFDKNSVGRITNRLSNDIYSIDLSIPWLLHVLAESGIKFIILPLTIALVLPWILIIMLVFVILSLWLTNHYRPANRDIKRLNSINEGKLLTILSETCSGLSVLRAFKKQGQQEIRYIASLFQATNTWALSSSVYMWYEVRLLIFSNLFFTVTILSCMAIVYSGISFDYTSLSFSITYASLITDNVIFFMQQLMNFEQSIISVERVRQYSTENKIEDLSTINKPSHETNDIIANNDCSVEFNNVDFSYDQGNTYALKNLSLQIKKGEKVAICGRTGSGKSSILNSLFRLYEIEEGQIFIDGKSIYDFSLKNLRTKMKIIPQFGFLYKANLKDNLDPENRFSIEYVKQKLKGTGLNIRNNKSEGESEEEVDLELQIEDGGKNLSNGEKQIINYWRIILEEQSIICLDEATSNMDPNTDQKIHDNLFRLAENKTLIVITHRLENINIYDRVIVLENGKIVQDEKGSEIKQNPQGFFKIHD